MAEARPVGRERRRRHSPLPGDPRSRLRGRQVVVYNGVESARGCERCCTVAGKRAQLGDDVTPHVLRRTLGTALSEAGVPVASAAAILGHSVEVNHGAYVKARRDAIQRDAARDLLVSFGLGVTLA